uniref:Ig-like domain-containing protein n=1 Tax=Chelonoidis abingdonii TaxID=106734 RepID=A0A8C0J0I2_CHEAB
MQPPNSKPGDWILICIKPLSTMVTPRGLEVGVSVIYAPLNSSLHWCKGEAMSFSMFWYLRREGKKPTCIKCCLDDQNVDKFVCKHKTHSSTLEISNVQKTESGIYYCAYKYSSYLLFGNGSTLFVGAGLLLLVVSMSLVWTLCPSTLGKKHSPPETSLLGRNPTPLLATGNCNCPIQHMNMLQMLQLPALISEGLFSES